VFLVTNMMPESEGDGEPVSRSLKHVIFEPGKKIYFLTYPPLTLIHVSHRFTRASKHPQQRSLLTVVSATSASLYQPLRHQRNVCHPVMNRFTRQTLPTISRKHFIMIILYIESFCPQENAQSNDALR
jgi:hypothetical protein